LLWDTETATSYLVSTFDRRYRDSYPSGLGQTLLQPIPVNNERAYREWLQKTRVTFSQIEDVLEKGLFTVSLQRVLKRKKLPSPALLGVENLSQVPGYTMPLSDGLYVPGLRNAVA
jgi:hypothetical protein